MENNHLKTFEVSGFKKFTDLKIDNIGQFNLIIGDNNVGKTSLLEALLIDNELDIFTDSIANINYFLRKFDQLKVPFINMYFSNSISQFPKVMSFKYQVGNNEIKSTNITAFKEREFYKNYVAQTDADQKLVITDDVKNTGSYNLRTPYITMGFFYTHELTDHYSKYVQQFSDKKNKLISSLGYLIPQLKNIEISIADTYVPILALAESGKNKLTPLASYGEGALKFFRILLSLFVDNHYSRLMIDELDAGIHHSHLANFNKSLIQAAKAEGKQIFATTHSKECIESFTRALEETGMQSEGRIIHLADTRSGIKAYTMNFEEFENALLAESEIR
jgi:AAA15 family ATPase/GTPase